MIVRRDARQHVRVRAEPRRIAGDNRVAQRIHGRRYGDRIARRLQRRQRVVQRLEHREIGRRTDAAGVRREIEQHDRELALGDFRAAQRDQLSNACRQRVGALGVRLHIAAAALRG
jgi:hypothetical protein